MLEACGGNLELAVDMHMDGAAVSQPSTSGAQEHVHNEAVRAPIPQTNEVLVDEAPQYGFRGRRRKARSVFDGFRDFQAEAEQQEEMQQQGVASVRTRKTRTLQDLFRPPIDLTYKGTFANAKDAGKSQGKWLMINIQNVQEFSCQALNRDVWSNTAVKTIIKEHFIFWQVYHDSEEGKKYRQFYKVNDWPYVAVLDPRTGENMVIWTKVEPITFCDLVTEFLSQHPNVDSLSPPAKRVRREDSIVDATETDQLQAAIQASLTEVAAPSKSSDLSVSDSDSGSELETFSDSEEEARPSPVKTRRTSGSESLRKSKGSPSRNSPNKAEMPSTSRSDKVSKRGSPLRKTKQSSPVPRTMKGGSPAPSSEKQGQSSSRTEKQGSPTSRKAARNSPLRTDESDSGENSASSKPKKVCSPQRTGSPLSKSSPQRKGSPNVKSASPRNSPQRKTPVKKSDSIHNEVHPAVIDNIRKSLDGDDKESSDVNESISGASDVTNSSRANESLESLTECSKMDYTKYLGKETDEKATLMLRLPNGQRDKLSIPMSSKLMAVITYVGSKGYSNERYELIAHFPRRELSHLDFEATLKEVGLHSQETIFIQSRS